MPDLTLRPRTRDDDEALIAIFQQYEDVFVMSLDEWRFHFDERSREAGKEPVMIVGEVDGKIVGDWYYEPHYSGAAGVYFGVVEVDGAETGKGFGTALWNDLEATLIARGVTKVYHSIRDDLTRSQSFAESKGFRKTGRAERVSRLNLDTANLEGYDGLDEKMKSEGVVIKTALDLDVDDDAFMHELHDAITSMVRDIPRTEEEFKPTPYENWRENFMKSPGSKPEAYWIAYHDGHPVGHANLQVMAGRGVLNGLTGVVPGFRHRGIARALKYETIRWARANGYEYIDTANDATNAPMLSINIPLGYVALPAREEWLKEYSQPSD